MIPVGIVDAIVETFSRNGKHDVAYVVVDDSEVIILIDEEPSIIIRECAEETEFEERCNECAN